MLFLQITTFSVIVTLLLLLILSMHKRNSTSLAFILQKMGKDFCDFFETTTTPAYLPLSFFFFFSEIYVILQGNVGFCVQ